MKIYENQRVADWAVVQGKNKLEHTRTGPVHISEVLRCLRQSYYSRTEPTPVTAEKVMHFAIGYALQEWFFGPEADGEEHNGIVFSVDLKIGTDVLEFKSTRKSYETKKGKFEPNPEWIERTTAYCAVHNVKRAHILVYFIHQDALHAWTIEPTDEEIQEVKRKFGERAGILTQALTSGEAPPVTTRSAEWECKFCPYTIHCKEFLDGSSGDNDKQ